MQLDDYTHELEEAINITVEAHSKYPKKVINKTRYWDKNTPYSIHPIWCAMTLLTETRLPVEIRRKGFQALLWHDILEDTNFSLPPRINKEIRIIINEMTFSSFQEEKQNIWECSDITKLFKLYDKVSNLLDASWMDDTKLNEYINYTLMLTDFVYRKFGQLNIVKIAKAICGGNPLSD